MTADPTERLQARVEAIEARQRMYQQHDPDCEKITAGAQYGQGPAARGGIVLDVLLHVQCDCWLSQNGS